MNDLVPLGDRAYLARFRDEAAAAGWAAAVRQRSIPGVTDVVLAYDSVGVYADPDRGDLDVLRTALESTEPEPADPALGLVHAIPVLYDGEDLEDAARALSLNPDRLVDLHTSVVYRVFALGFLPGFPYCGYLPRELEGLPRRASPRTRVPAGSVAIVGRQTAIYPEPSPGGWHLIGRTPLRIVDPAAGAFPVRAGDRLRFVAVDEDEFRRRRGELLTR